MEYLDLRAQYDVLKRDIDRNIQKVIDKGRFIMGPEVAELEEKLAEFCGVKYCVTVANGTDALQMALMLWNIGPGDAVFLPSFTFNSTAEVIGAVKATPVFTDIDPKTFNLDTKSLREAILRVRSEGKLKPKVIIAVDLFGQAANYPEIYKIADEYDLFVLEDGAQGFGASIQNQRVGSFGDIGTTSFSPANPLGCYGDGGAIFTDDASYYESLKSIRIHGKGGAEDDHVRPGLNSRLDTIQAAILLAKFEAFTGYELDRRNELANFYNSSLPMKLLKPIVPDGYYSSWAQYSLLAPSEEARSIILASLTEAGIPSHIYYRLPLHEQTVYKHLGYKREDLPVSADIARRVFSVPLHPYLSFDDAQIIVTAIRAAVKLLKR